jgi:tetraacyldisaccharide 4'-kinase
LRPLSRLYEALTDWRNRLYDTGRLRSQSGAVPTLSVGNLAVGGTGKTPHVEYLLRLLHPAYRLGFLSRGYGRRTRGFRLATPADTAETLGDEPRQVYRKFGATLPVAVGERRVPALAELRRRVPDLDWVLLDDAFQHRALRPDLNLLLTDYHRPFDQDQPFPAGRLREGRAGARRADAVVVTKCPSDLSRPERARRAAALRQYAGAVPVFFSTLVYAAPVPVSGAVGTPPAPVLLVSGLAQPALFETEARRRYAVTSHQAYPDHHAYTPADWAHLQRLARQQGAGALLTTEKDAVKLETFAAAHEEGDCPVFYLPVAVHFLAPDAGPTFDEWIRQQIAQRTPPTA